MAIFPSFSSVTARAQIVIPSPEKFINAVFPTVVDSTLPHYFLVVGADTCRFVKYDYDEWSKYHLLEPVPISILNELAEKVYLSRHPYFWKQDSLAKAICINRRQAELHPLPQSARRRRHPPPPRLQLLPAPVHR